MRDHYFIDRSGRRTAVADLPLGIIEDVLRSPQDYGADSSDGPGGTMENVLERLRIEVVVRRLGLR